MSKSKKAPSRQWSIPEAVERGIVIKRQIESLTEELKEINTYLCAKAEHGPQIPLIDEDREGRQFLAQSEQHVLPVVITADLLTKSFPAGSALHHKLEALAGLELPKLYATKTILEITQDDGKKFRQLVEATLPGEFCGEFLAACTRKDKHGLAISQTKVEWDRAHPVSLVVPTPIDSLP